MLHYLAAHCALRVLALRPVPILVGQLLRSRDYQPCAEEAPFKPVYLPVAYIPKIGSRVNPRLMANAIRPVLARLQSEVRFDAVLTAWAYPDGCAMATLTPDLSLPLAVIAQGTDIHEYLQMPTRRSVIRENLKNADMIITRSKDLGNRLRQADFPAEKLRVIYNGVDTTLFQPRANQPADQQRSGRRSVLYVGNFESIKNPHLAVRAFAKLREQASDLDLELIMLGDGPLKAELQKLGTDLGLGDRLRMPGVCPPAEVAEYMRRASVLCVPSVNEGVPNVIYEALACGLPVVATRVGGIPEVMVYEHLGMLVESQDVSGMAQALQTIIERPPDFAAIQTFIQNYSWPKTAERYYEVLQQIVRRGA
ncbi:MAG: glycosyltransferase [Verrucomicrobiota bacterium]